MIVEAALADLTEMFDRPLHGLSPSTRLSERVAPVPLRGR